MDSDIKAYYEAGKGTIVQGNIVNNYTLIKSKTVSFSTSCHSSDKTATITWTFDYPIKAFVELKSDQYVTASTPSLSGRKCTITFTDIRAENYDADGSPTWFSHDAYIVVMCKTN